MRMREYCYLWEHAKTARLNERAKGSFSKSNDKNVTEARYNIDMLLQLLRYLFKISTTTLEFNKFNIFILSQEYVY